MVIKLGKVRLSMTLKGVPVQRILGVRFSYTISGVLREKCQIFLQVAYKC